MSKRIFISADHGMAIIYFLQSDVVPMLLEAGVEIVVLTDDETKDRIAQRFARPGLTFEGLRLKEANKFAKADALLKFQIHYHNAFWFTSKSHL